MFIIEQACPVLNVDVPEKTDGKYLRHCYDAVRNKMKSLRSLGLKPDDNPACPWCCFLSLT